MKIKTISCIYECHLCGTKIRVERNIVIDKYLNKKLELPKPMMACSCGNITIKYLVDIKIENHINQSKQNKKEEN